LLTGVVLVFRLDDRSRMTRECHVRICGGLGGKFPGATRRRSLRLEAGDELRPEGFGLAVAQLEAQQLAATILVHPHGDDDNAGADLQGLAQPSLEVGGIQVDVGIACLLQRPAQERLDLLIDFLADSGSPEISGDCSPGISGVPLRLT
jgi:hypothetical protein